jgi:hypothetical protein
MPFVLRPGHPPKCMIYPHLNMAIGFRGIHLVGMVLMSSFSSAISFDDVRRNFAKIVQGQVDATKSKWIKMLGRRAMQFDMAVAGWSKDGPRGLFLSTIERPGTPVFRAIEVDQLITPSSNILFAETSSVFARPDFSIERDMIAIAEKQRNASLTDRRESKQRWSGDICSLHRSETGRFQRASFTAGTIRSVAR